MHQLWACHLTMLMLCVQSYWCLNEVARDLEDLLYMTQTTCLFPDTRYAAEALPRDCDASICISIHTLKGLRLHFQKHKLGASTAPTHNPPKPDPFSLDLSKSGLSIGMELNH